MNAILRILDEAKLAITTQLIHVRREAPGFMPLVVERVFDPPPAPIGAITHVSMAHYFIHNGDLMADPEITFSVYKLADYPGLETLGIVARDSSGTAWLFIPTSVKMDSIGDYQESFVGDDPEALMVSKSGQRAKCIFCRQWDLNIKDQGFITCVPS
jgi:hypothetical protein